MLGYRSSTYMDKESIAVCAYIPIGTHFVPSMRIRFGKNANTVDLKT